MRPFLSPKWLLSHVFVLSMVVLMATLGFWQLNRLQERKDRNDDVRTATEAAPVDIEDLLDPDPLDPDPLDPDPLDHTAVLVRGEYLDEMQFLVANRTFESQPGA